MSAPSDVTPDVQEAAERMVRPPAPHRLTIEQKGWMAAAFVAFLGIVYGGPALARLRATPTLRQRVGRRTDAWHRSARRAGADLRKTTRKRVRRLGGGSIWR